MGPVLPYWAADAPVAELLAPLLGASSELASL